MVVVVVHGWGWCMGGGWCEGVKHSSRALDRALPEVVVKRVVPTVASARQPPDACAWKLRGEGGLAHLVDSSAVLGDCNRSRRWSQEVRSMRWLGALWALPSH